MFVAAAHRGRGYARAVLAELERTAAAAGRRRTVLETGTRQPEAIALYTSAGYAPMAAFGVYRDSPNCRCFAKPLRPSGDTSDQLWRDRRDAAKDALAGDDAAEGGTHGHAGLAQTDLRLDANALDYVFVAFYFVLVLGIGLVARRSVSSSLDFLLSGRSLPAWVTGLAFISANLGAIELIGMTANGAQYGIPTAHYYWIGAVPAMVFLGIVMMPFYYGSKARSVPEFLAQAVQPHHPAGPGRGVRAGLGADRGGQPVRARPGPRGAARLAASRSRSRWPRWWCSATPSSAGCRRRSTTRCCSSS